MLPFSPPGRSAYSGSRFLWEALGACSRGCFSYMTALGGRKSLRTRGVRSRMCQNSCQPSQNNYKVPRDGFWSKFRTQRDQRIEAVALLEGSPTDSRNSRDRWLFIGSLGPLASRSAMFSWLTRLVHHEMLEASSTLLAQTRHWSFAWGCLQ